MKHVRRLALLPLPLVLAVGGLTACESAPTTLLTDPSTVQLAPAAGSADDAVNKVLAISVDGLNPSAITTLGSAKLPAFARLIREGASTFNARTEQELTRTLPNHTGMLTGRRITAAKHGHGVTFNYDNGGTVHQAAGHYVASVFDVVHDRGGSTAMFAAKTKFAFYARSWNTKGARDTVGRNNGRAKIGRVTIDEDNARLVGKLNAELRSKPRTFTFLHISLPDAAGHAHGWMSADYLRAVRRTDKLLGSVLRTIDSRPRLKRQLLVLLTADHGGRPGRKSHSDPARLVDFRVPFMAWGPRVPAHRNLYGLNPDFADPGKKRTSYAGKQPIRNGDIANVVTDALDLPPVPGSTLDRPRRLDLFR